MSAPDQPPEASVPVPKRPIGVVIQQGRSSLTYAYAIEKLRSEISVGLACCWAFSVFIVQWLPLDYWTKIILQIPLFTMIFVMIAIHAKLSWGRGYLVVSLAQGTFTRREVPRRKKVLAPPEEQVSIRTLSSLHLMGQQESGKSKIRNAQLVTHGTQQESTTLVTGRYAPFIFRHLETLCQKPEVKNLLPHIKFIVEISSPRGK